jgi:hypothetical protein
MKIKKLYLMIGFMLVFVLAIGGCKSRQPAAEKAAVVSETVSKTDTLLVKIKREACFGRCPQYYATIYKTGWAEYYGERNVKKIGPWYARLTYEQLDYLYEAIRGNKMESMDTAYSNPYLADFPVYYLWVADKKPRKQIMLNHESLPTEIDEFTKILEGLLDQLRWEQHPKARKDEE